MKARVHPLDKRGRGRGRGRGRERERPLSTAAGVVPTDRPRYLFILEEPDGRRAAGEASPLPEAGTETADACRRALEQAADWLNELSVADHSGSFHPRWLQPLWYALTATPAARHAVETALLNRLARHTKRPLVAVLGGAADTVVRSHALIRDPAPTVAAGEARAAVTAGYRVLKLKVGAGGPEVDADRLAAVREAAGPDVRLRLDANGAWGSPCQARDALMRIGLSQVALVEQPLAVGREDQLGHLQAEVGVPLGLDESVSSEGAALRVLSMDRPCTLILKPMRLGGPWTCVRIAAAARTAGRSCLVTTLLDTPLAVATAAHLAAAIAPEAVHGLSAARAEDERPRWHLEDPPTDGLGMDAHL